MLSFIQVLQAEGKQKDQAIEDLNKVLDNMRSKMEQTDEQLTQLRADIEAKDELLKSEKDKWEAEKTQMEASYR